MRIGTQIKNIQKYICVNFVTLEQILWITESKNKLKKVQKFMMKKWSENRHHDAP